MKRFECQRCGQLLHFEDTRCVGCGYRLGYLPDRAILSALTSEAGEIWRPLAAPAETFRCCVNAPYIGCNWLVPADSEEISCGACQLNRAMKIFELPEHMLLWRRLEAAKRRLVYGLMRLNLPLSSRQKDVEQGLVFNFVTNSATESQDFFVIHPDHAHGVITIDIAEAEDVEHEHNRLDMIEPFRTLLGHFRHEAGHHYWERLVKNGVWQEAFRHMFGDERRDSHGAMVAYHYKGPPDDWQDRYVSQYACMHPREDFAETWAYYLYIIDAVETASSCGLLARHLSELHPTCGMKMKFDAYHRDDFKALMATWLSFNYAVKCFNRSMGRSDPYSFMPAPAVMGKLRFIHGLILSVPDLFAHRLQESNLAPTADVSPAFSAKNG